MEEIKYSFSRLESFHNCKRSYYYTYILGQRGGDNIYSYLGTVVHELTQGIIEGKETNETAVAKFIVSIEDSDMLGLRWISDKVKSNYQECIIHFLENYDPVKSDTIKIEDYFEINILNKIIRGYIDLWYILNDELYIVDLKTSSKFSKKDLIDKQRQLLLYAYALKDKYPGLKIKLCFNMLKYVIQKGKLLERNKINIFDDYQDGIVEVEYSDELEEDLIQYIKNTTDEIEIMDNENKDLWEKSYNPNTDFFCVNLCSHRKGCIKDN